MDRQSVNARQLSNVFKDCQAIPTISLQEGERERCIESFPPISGLIRCVEDPFYALINESQHADHISLPHERYHSVCLSSLRYMRALVRKKVSLKSCKCGPLCHGCADP